MARASSPTGLSLAQLQKLMKSRQSEMSRLTRSREKLVKKLEAIDEKIAAVSGGVGGGGGGTGGVRARNNVSLQDTILTILTKAGGPMSVGDILDKVTASGYRSNSAN